MPTLQCGCGSLRDYCTEFIAKVVVSTHKRRKAVKMAQKTTEDIFEEALGEDDGQDSSEKKSKTVTIQLTEHYRLKYDKYKNKWIEKHIRNVNKNENSKKFGEVSDYWDKVAGFMPTYELLCDDFVVKKSARAEARNVKDILQSFADAEKEVRKLARKIGAELDRRNKEV